ncbi:SWIM zinc finger domain-containing protein [Myxococcota bacterium]|nr:SWIM zinc finger domain-containing protein [Myxococcota bacterium]MBU1432155.1 SWIM zinc finger domain-containing protein [Myxococcota bacterium]MBU1899711.1 SWIM zinc finger domain-containing protein [Myxococcota bacterium]
MEFQYRYSGNTAIESRPDQTSMRFSPDTQRDPTYFRGLLRKNIPFREAISALHSVVVSDLRFKPKDREEYKAWLATQEQFALERIAAEHGRAKREMAQLHEELRKIDLEQQKHSVPFNKAKRRYFDYLYKRDYNAWFVLDPVITVHPDQVFFECFSQDESSYGRLSANYDVFKDVKEFECGTTNIDYSAELYNEFQKIRSYKPTDFTIDPSGFQVQTIDEASFSDAFKEVKIDLPDSWVRGFLQVSSAMSLPATAIKLHPMDIHNICFVLRQKQELHGPRSMRYILKPGRPVQILMEPWNIKIDCPRSIYEGDTPQEIRVWGRRRLHILERLIPIADYFTVYLLGTGLPSFYIAHLGDMAFTLGLSGWTANDWSTAGNFDLMAPRAEVDALTSASVFEALKADWRAAPDDLARKLGLDRAVVLGALGTLTQAGRAIYDLEQGVYRARELSREPLPLSALRFANEREATANRFVMRRQVTLIEARQDSEGHLHLDGAIQADQQTHYISLTIDADERIKEAQCDCAWFRHNRLYKGPCEHILALRISEGQSNHRRH